MTTAKHFIEQYLQERSSVFSEANLRLRPIYESYFGEPLLQHLQSYLLSDPQVVDQVNESETTAGVITRAEFSKTVKRRYRLSAAGDTWKIIGIDWECFLCHGTGKKEDSSCRYCKGEGWRSFDAETQ